MNLQKTSDEIIQDSWQWVQKEENNTLGVRDVTKIFYESIINVIWF